jgi:hypothetical protein
MMTKLRPGYAGPTEDELSGKLLDQAVEEVDAAVSKAIKGNESPICIMQDGWSSVNNDPIIGTSIQVI